MILKNQKYMENGQFFDEFFIERVTRRSINDYPASPHKERRFETNNMSDGVRTLGESLLDEYMNNTAESGIFDAVADNDIKLHGKPFRVNGFSDENVGYKNTVTGGIDKTNGEEDYFDNGHYLDAMNFREYDNVDEMKMPGDFAYSNHTKFNNITDNNSDTSVSNGNKIPLNAYKLQYDPSPTIVRKVLQGSPLVSRQNISIKYLKPPPLPAPGALIIREVRPPQLHPAPPLIIRQRPPVPPTPAPLILREKPPLPPKSSALQVINKQLPPLPPPPRQVIIERYPPLPPKPRDIIIERWLPYSPLPKRKVLYQRAAPPKPVRMAKNTVIYYEAPKPKVQRNFRRLGIIQMDPGLYVQKYNNSLMESSFLTMEARRAGVIEDISVPNDNSNNRCGLHNENAGSSRYLERNLVDYESNDDMLDTSEQHFETLSPDNRVYLKAKYFDEQDLYNSEETEMRFPSIKHINGYIEDERKETSLMNTDVTEEDFQQSVSFSSCMNSIEYDNRRIKSETQNEVRCNSMKPYIHNVIPTSINNFTYFLNGKKQPHVTSAF